MANGDPLRVGLTQPPDNRATASTMLVHNGSAFGTQDPAFLVKRLGAPRATAAIRGENFSTGTTAGGISAGVLGMVRSFAPNIGVLGTIAAAPPLFTSETGVMGVTNGFGVVGQSLSGLLQEGNTVIASPVGVLGRCDAGTGVRATAVTGFGLIAESRDRAGVTGTSVADVGVDARSTGSHALRAVSEVGIGAFGQSRSNSGVQGQSATGVGVLGITEQGVAGVRGFSAARPGVFGESGQGVGVLGVSPTHAVRGMSVGGNAASSIGVGGMSDVGAGAVGTSTRGIGVVGHAPRGTAGLFVGPVVVQGSLQVTGAKSAAIRHADGSHRLVFCVESPQSWLEDFGEAELRGASVKVPLPKDFAPLIKRGDYQVFLSTYGPESVYVARRGKDGFEIARLPSAEGKPRPVAVGYRIVGRRADVKAERLPKAKLDLAPPTMASVDLPPAKAKRKERVEATLTPLPRAPKLPVIDLKRLTAEAESATEGGSKRSTRKRKSSPQA